MKNEIKTLEISTNGQGFYEFTSEINEWLSKKKKTIGLLTIYIRHTSC